MDELRKNSSLFSLGDRVYLTGNHPWAESSGVIVARWAGSPNLGLDWEVELDSGDYPSHQVAAGEREMEHEKRSARA